MNLIDLQNRLETLQSEQKQLQQQITQIGANINAYSGAIQECQYWIGVINAEMPEPKPYPAPEVDTSENVLFG